MKTIISFIYLLLFAISVNGQIGANAQFADASAQEINLNGGGNVINRSDTLVYVIVNASSGQPGTGIIPRGSINVTIGFPNQYGINQIPTLIGWQIPNNSEYPTAIGAAGQINLINDVDIAEGETLNIEIPVVGFAVGTGVTTLNIERTIPITTADVNPNNNQLANSFTVSAVLPVVFGPINASLKGNSFTINWQTATEKNNKEFVVQVSADGKEFHTVGTVASLAKDGNSDTALDYTFSKTWNEISSLLGFPLIAGLLLTALGVALLMKNRRKMYYIPALLILAFASFMGCRKDEKQVDTGDVPDVYVRIGQVDIDGTTAYSRVVKAIKE